MDKEKKTMWNILGAISFFLLTMLTHVLDQGGKLMASNKIDTKIFFIKFNILLKIKEKSE